MAPRKQSRQDVAREIANKINARPIIQEKEFPESDACEFYPLALKQGYGELLKKREPYNETVVRLFYMQSRMAERLQFKLRGCDLTINADMIREFWKLNPVEECQYQYYRNNDHLMDWDEVLRTLGEENASWAKRGRIQTYLARGQMTEEARIWLHFICYNVLPISHVSDATKERALLIYLLMTTQPVDIALWVEDAITKCALTSSTRANLIFPHLISDLLFKQGVPAQDTDDWVSGVQSHIYTIKQPSQRASDTRAKKKGKRVVSEAEEEEIPTAMEEDVPAAGGTNLALFKLDQVLHNQTQLMSNQGLLLAAEKRRQ